MSSWSGHAPVFYAGVVSNENCKENIFDFCETCLKIPNARNVFHIDRAQRSPGCPISGKERHIIVKFKDTDTKLIV